MVERRSQRYFLFTDCDSLRLLHKVFEFWKFRWIFDVPVAIAKDLAKSDLSHSLITQPSRNWRVFGLEQAIGFTCYAVTVTCTLPWLMLYWHERQKHKLLFLWSFLRRSWPEGWKKVSPFNSFTLDILLETRECRFTTEILQVCATKPLGASSQLL